MLLDVNIIGQELYLSDMMCGSWNVEMDTVFAVQSIL